MNDSVEAAEQIPDAPAVESIPARHLVRPIPVRRRKRFLASVRYNEIRYLVLGGALLLAWGLLRAAMWEGAGKPEGTFMLVLAGGLLAAAAKTAIDILDWLDETRRAVHVERVHAVRRVFHRACAVREQAVLDWRRIHTVLVDNLTGESQEIRLFHDHDETDTQAERLFQRARSEELWIRRDGVDAVRRFKMGITTLDYDALQREPEFLAAFDAHLESLRRDLALAAIGIRLD